MLPHKFIIFFTFIMLLKDDCSCQKRNIFKIGEFEKSKIIFVRYLIIPL